MKIHAICLVKNDVDIVAHCLQTALQWADCVYVFDNGSTDGTWEAVKSIESERVIPWKSEAKRFREGLRSEVFNEFRNRSAKGDWWCRLDADEFYTIQDPRSFLAAVPPSCHVVWGIMVEYYLTHEDVESIDFQTAVEALLPKLKYYKAAFSEPRFFRYRDRLEWIPDWSWPKHVGVVFRDRILYRHYKYRSPDQIRTRLATRQAAIEEGFEGWGSVKVDSWEEKVCDRAHLSVDDGTEFHVDESILPQHMPPSFRYFLQRVMHSTGIWA